MKSALKTIEKQNLIQEGDKIGVAVSGGRDSMALLNFLNELSKEKNFECIAITVDHGLRETSANDVKFVSNYCNKNNIKVYTYKVDAQKLSAERGLSIEAAARECRYRVFKALISKKVVNKIALGHHLQDQAETILLNILRGSGITGASGMDYIRDDVYIRPLLRTDRSEIMAYINSNDIPYVDDETNSDSDYNRNYLRNMIMPLLRNRWSNVYQAICNFGELCKIDDDYINSTISNDSVIYESDYVVKIPVNYFSYPISVVNRMLRKAFKGIRINVDIERKHLKIINQLAIEAENGAKITLPNHVSVIKEYNYITITNRNFKPEPRTWELQRGKIDIPNFGVLDCQITRKLELGEFSHLVDYNKIPKNAVWRYRKDGDVFTKFGGGTKTLSDFLIDEKIPQRLRTFIPVLASGNEILIVAGVEISDKVKITKQTKTAWGINAVRF